MMERSTCQEQTYRALILNSSTLKKCRFCRLSCRGQTSETLSAARFSYAALSETDFSETTITHKQLNEAFGDTSVILPDGKGPNDLEWPEHWSKEKLDYEEFETKWRAFQKAGGFDPDNPN